MDTKFRDDVVYMNFDRMFRQSQFRGNTFVLQPSGNHFQDLNLPCRQFRKLAAGNSWRIRQICLTKVAGPACPVRIRADNKVQRKVLAAVKQQPDH